MGCNCKNKNNGDLTKDLETDETLGEKLLIFSVKVLLFIFVSIVVSIVIIPFSIYAVYKAIFKDGNLDIVKFITNTKKYFNKNTTIINSTPKPNVGDAK
tara:strand:- start:26799 stop:27095 length:297 start_codon:yes stop_codon:yes gene_type:complete